MSVIWWAFIILMVTSLVVPSLFSKTRCNFTYRSSASCCVVLCYYPSACLLLQLQIVFNSKHAVSNIKLCLRPQNKSYRELSLSHPLP